MIKSIVIECIFFSSLFLFQQFIILGAFVVYSFFNQNMLRTNSLIVSLVYDPKDNNVDFLKSTFMSSNWLSVEMFWLINFVLFLDLTLHLPTTIRNLLLQSYQTLSLMRSTMYTLVGKIIFFVSSGKWSFIFFKFEIQSRHFWINIQLTQCIPH